MRLKTNVMVQRYFFLIYFCKFLKRKEKKYQRKTDMSNIEIFLENCINAFRKAKDKSPLINYDNIPPRFTAF